jgi:hypothetical protein
MHQDNLLDPLSLGRDHQKLLWKGNGKENATFCTKSTVSDKGLEMKETQVSQESSATLREIFKETKA